MAKTLCLRFLQPVAKLDELSWPDCACEWLTIFADGSVDQGPTQASLAEVAAVEEVDEWVLIVPGEDVLHMPVKPPTRQARQLQQALPYLVEEGVGQDIEQLHIAQGPKLSGGELLVAVVGQQRMQAWLDGLSSVDIVLDGLLADCQLIPSSDDEVLVYLDGQRSLLAGAATPLSDLTDNLPQWATLIGSAENAPKQWQFAGTKEDLANQDLTLNTLAMELAQEGGKHEVRPLKHSAFAELAANVPKVSKQFNMLQGPYAPASKGQSPLARWRPVAIAAGLCLALQVGFDQAKAVFFDTEAAKVDTQITSLYQNLFPGSKIVNIKVQMQSKINEANSSQGDTDFIALLAQAAQQIKAMGRDTKLQINQLRYDDKKQDLLLELKAGTLEELDRFKQGLAKKGLGVEILSANEKEGGIKGRVQIKANS